MSLSFPSAQGLMELHFESSKTTFVGTGYRVGDSDTFRRCGNGYPLVQLHVLSYKGPVFASSTKGAFDGTFNSYSFKQRKIAKKTFSMTSIKKERFCEEEQERGHRHHELVIKMPRISGKNC